MESMDVTVIHTDGRNAAGSRRGLRRLAAVLIAVAAAATTPSAAPQANYAAVELSALATIHYIQPNAADVKAKRNRPADLPAWIKALDGKRVNIRGYMLPYDVGTSTVYEFMLVANNMSCCFAAPTNATDWVSVTMKGSAGAYMSQDEIGVRGTLSVGEEFDQAGYITSLFRIVADAVDGEPSRR